MALQGILHEEKQVVCRVCVLFEIRPSFMTALIPNM